MCCYTLDELPAEKTYLRRALSGEKKKRKRDGQSVINLGRGSVIPYIGTPYIVYRSMYLSTIQFHANTQQSYPCYNNVVPEWIHDDSMLMCLDAD